MVTLSHATVGSNDLTKAKAFYDALFGSVGITPVFEHPSGGRIYGSAGKPILGVLGPYDKRPATSGNGSMVAFKCETQDEVRRMHATALSLGGKDEGAPGERRPNMYFAYFRDLDGNKLCAFCFG
jgi:catechol 2,3-dioxygenase-like lactoylglutathione lyase family enzyme